MAFNRRKFLQTTGASAIAAATLGTVKAQTGKPSTSSPADKATTQSTKSTAQSSKTTTSGATQTAKAKASKNHKRKVMAANAPKPAGPYSPAIVSGNLVFVSGQVAFDPHTGNIEANTFEEQATQVFENIKALVEAAGSSLDQVLSVRVFLADLNDFAKLNTIYRQYFTEDFPTRTTVGAQLLSKALIEVDCVATL